MPDALAEWSRVLDELEAAVALMDVGGAEAGGAAARPWRPPAGAGPLPAELRERAERLVRAQEAVRGRLQARRRAAERRLTALRRLPASRGDVAVYLDVRA